MALQLQMHRAGNQVDKMVESEAMGASSICSVARVGWAVNRFTDSFIAPDGCCWEAVLDALTLDECRLADGRRYHSGIRFDDVSRCRCVMVLESRCELTTPRRGPCRSS